MAKYQLKTKKNATTVSEYLRSITDPGKKKDAKAMIALMKQVTGKKPAMWGASIVGFGEYHYTYASGQEGDWMATHLGA